MNRKNPGLAETEPMSKDEQAHFYRYSAVGWTIAAALYTVYAVWRWGGHHWGSVGPGWLMAAWTWVATWLERRRAGQRK